MAKRLLLALSFLATNVHGSKEILQRLLRNELFDTDMSCISEGARSHEACAAMQCSWCSMGSKTGICLSNSQATTINAASIPHFHCGPEEATSAAVDAEFWDSLLSCQVGSTSADACGGAPGCTWCETVQGPSFGVCMSDSFLMVMGDRMKNLPDSGLVGEVAQLIGEAELWRDWTVCGSADNADAPALFDMTCAIYTVLQSQSQCEQATSKSGNPCSWVTPMEGVNLCLAPHQMDFVDHYMHAMHEAGVELNFSGAQAPVEKVQAITLEEEEIHTEKGGEDPF